MSYPTTTTTTQLLLLLLLLLQLSGFILSALSAYTIAYRHSLADLLSSDGSSLYSTLTYLLVVSSGTLIVVSVLGCCGTAKENRCLLLMVCCDAISPCFHIYIYIYIYIYNIYEIIIVVLSHNIYDTCM